VAKTMPFELRSVRPSLFKMLLLGFAFQIFGIPNAVMAQNKPQTSILPSEANSAAPAREKSRSELERELLLPLLLQERELLARCGRDHPELKALQDRIAGVKDYLATVKAESPEPSPVARPTTRLTNQEGHQWTKASPSSFGTAFDQNGPKTNPAGFVDPSRTDRSIATKFQPLAEEGISSPLKVKSAGNLNSYPDRFGKKSSGDSITADPLRSSGSKAEIRTTSPAPDRTTITRPVASEMTADVSSLNQQSASSVWTKIGLRGEEPGSSDHFLKISGRQFVCFFGALLVCLFAHLAALCLILRHYASQTSSHPVQQPVRQSSGISAPESFQGDRGIADINGFSLAGGALNLEKPSFDVSATSLELSWADELKKKEEAEARKGEAIFLDLFRQNMELKRQLIVAGEAS
jgi:hypothetical protein